ncbi:TPA: ribonuclease J [Enterococcus faecium]|uniref:ribonuclease J n=1 Tax=Enterococcus TaxID=1350 RepID=UPI0002A1FEF3|nr:MULTISPECIES: ribonuclease J [Enterococcus]ELB23232.1 metallo-beta-lactamase [Enterococcus faecium EnGen0039]ELB60157.1 metallo-beta-lactamase [Enterococcus faecium EnGen0052]MBE5026766.1 ribonuclease J [Enterococcus faecium]MCW8065552.1 ribonuclease J [Enterococcus lactis]MCW8067884.1 ribonuclease J [Enterococcus lactis]
MSTIKIIPLGGVRENGKNMYVAEVGEDIFILDCGLKYPENELLGIDVVIPDFTYLEENIDRVAGVFLTHGHADAIGALPYLLSKISVPVFGTELTIELAKLNVSRNEAAKGFKDFHVVDEHTEIDFGETVVSFFRTTHTIPDSVGINLKTKEGSIVYTGDFKFDQTAIPMYQTDYARLAEIGKEGVLALLSESANAENPQPVASEAQIADEVFDTIKYWEGRIIVACVASNLQRVQQVLDAAEKAQRKVVLTGQDFERIIRTAMRLEKLQLPSEDLLVTLKDMKNYDPEELIILETGRMGEPIKSLQKMANGTHRNVKIEEGDLVYITTTPSIAMETIVAKTEDIIYRAGGTVKLISENMRVSGHANPNDLQLMINLMKPTYFVPVQGEYRELAAHADLAHAVGMPYKNIYITGRGDVLEYKNKRMSVTGTTSAENVMIDGLGIGDIGNIVLRDRKILSEDGIFVAVVTISRREKKIISKPQITSRGFVYVKASRDLMKESSNMIETIVEKHLESNDFEWSKLKQDIRDQLGRYLFEQTKRRPVILPVIMEATQRRNKK